jgi:hypothetical protein
MALIDPAWMQHCSMKRVICHWTAGGLKASHLDREHYHILVEADGSLVRGNRTIFDNVSTADKIYAAHTLGANTGSIGIAACCMAGAEERPFKAGQAPMTRKQWETMAQAVAELCRFYRIPVTPTTVLGHGEVEVNLGIKQRGKWDPMVLPWNPGLSKTEVGEAFRSLVRIALEGEAPPEEVRPIRLTLRGREIAPAFLDDGGAWAEAGALSAALGWTQGESGATTLRFTGAGAPSVALPAVEVPGEGRFVDVEDLAAALGLALAWNSENSALKVG